MDLSWLKYLDYFQQLESVLAVAKHAQVGTEVTIPRIVTDIDGHRWEIDEHKARRVR